MPDAKSGKRGASSAPCEQGNRRSFELFRGRSARKFADEPRGVGRRDEAAEGKNPPGADEVGNLPRTHARRACDLFNGIDVRGGAGW